MSSLFQYPRLQDPDDLRDPSELRMRVAALKIKREVLSSGLKKVESRLNELRSFLSLAPEVEGALQVLSEKMFLDLVTTLEEKLTIALQEVLEQPLVLRAETSYKRGGATVEFYIERSGNREDIMSGQGGSVVNVLSVGLRMFAMTTLDEAEHRRFLVLDEPDGWLRPELVPRLVKIIHDAGKALGFQVLLISHHDVEVFRAYADKIYGFTPQPDGSVRVVCISDAKHEPSTD
ncbi:MAG TPA: hypothetical protein VEX38_10280 [Fimbriimonadaceae bacterium]|nr:hypothetical protein [Fimbriimonadaceae bacterium]